MLYAAIGFHHSHLEIAIQRPFAMGKEKLTLRAIPLPVGAICEHSGKVRSRATVRQAVKQGLKDVEGEPSLRLMLGIPNNLCKNSIVRHAQPRGDTTAARVESDQDTPALGSELLSHVESLSDTATTLVVSASEQHVMHYVEVCLTESKLISRITPIYAARYNFIQDSLQSEASRAYVMIQVNENVCEIALWTGTIPMYQECISRDGALMSWISECSTRVIRVIGRVDQAYSIILRGPSELIDTLRVELPAASIVNFGDYESRARRYVDDNELARYQSGYFDAVLGLLAQAQLEMGRGCD